MRTAAVTVNDIEFEPEADDRSKACMSVAVATDEPDMDFSLTFPLQDQPGHVDVALEDGRAKLIRLFESALGALKRRGLRLS